MSNKNKALPSEIYTTGGFSDLVSSPVFYSVLVLTIFLGLSSAFGFLQNPLKLKAVVEVISKKVSSSDNSSRVVNQNEYLISRDMIKDLVNKATISFIDGNRYSIFSENFYGSEFDLTSSDGIKPISFDYDITSRQFWGDLDMSRIESTVEESQRNNSGSLIIGTPLEFNLPAEKDSSKYSMNAGRFFSL